MLEVEISRPGFAIRNSSPIKMPVDFHSYLLAGSPPGFDYYTLRADRFAPQNRPIVQSSSDPDLSKYGSSDTDYVGACIRAVRSDEDYTKSTSDLISVSSLSLNEDRSTRVQKKRVRFADELGMCLNRVKILTETSDTPPRLNRAFLSNLTKGQNASASQTPPLVLNFKQPASQYLEFRAALDRNCVSLENMRVRNYSLSGTVKVKNIAFEKSVKVRYTMNKWETHTDVAGVYVPQPALGCPHDTFTFEITVPTDFDDKEKLEFCVCYQVNNQQFWDNNNGKNYEVVSADYRSSPDPPQPKSKEECNIFSHEFDDDWADYSTWNALDTSAPYY